MSIGRRFLYLSTVVVVLFLLHISVFAVGARFFGFSITEISIYSFAFSLLVLLLYIGPRIKDVAITSFLYVLASTWLGFLFLFFSATVVYEIFRLTLTGELFILYFHLMVFAALAGVYALFNARRLVVKEVTITVKNLSTPVRIAHLSDVHIGTVHRTAFLERVVSMTNDGSPDVVLMTGDLFDGSASIHEEMLRPLDKLIAPTYFSMGNHEEYEGLQLVRETIAGLKMQLLDSQVAHSHGLQIIGINDRQSLPKNDSLGSILPTLSYDREKPTLLMYHTPVEWNEARAAGIDLMLSGHTHNGQLFPFTLLVHFAFKYVCGLFEQDGHYLHITPGTGTWGPPMRLGSQNQITFINLEPK